MSKSKQIELPGIPGSEFREILLERVEISDLIGDNKERLIKLDDIIRKAMRSKGANSWRVETEDGRKLLFHLKVTGEKIVVVRLKQPKTVSKEK